MNINKRFKIIALLVISMELPDIYQRKVDTVAKMIDSDSDFKRQALEQLEAQVLEYIEDLEFYNFCQN